MTISSISEVIRGWLGWCPQAQAVKRMVLIRSDEAITSPAGGGEHTACSYRWLQRFRNWILVQALLYSALIAVFLPFIINRGEYLPFLIAGLVTALLVFGLRAGMLWKQYENIRTKGTVEETVLEKKVVPALIIAFITGAIVIGILALFGFIPGLDFLMVPAFAIGSSILPWLMLMLVVLWEGRTGCRLYLDRPGLNVTTCAVQDP